MKRIIAALSLVALAAAGCSLPQPKGPYRHCIPDSGLCWFEDYPPR